MPATEAKQPVQPILVFGSPLSGHTHRVLLFLSLLDLPHESVPVDLRAGAHKKPEFLRRNAFGQVPVIEDGETVLADSNAILVYLNERYAADPGRWYPRDPLGAAQVQRWLSVAAGQLAFGPCVARVIELFKIERDTGEIVERSHQLLRVMDSELGTRAFLAGPMATLADIANYTYVAHAPEGRVTLDPYPKVGQWLARIEALPGFVPMKTSAIGLRA